MSLCTILGVQSLFNLKNFDWITQDFDTNCEDIVLEFYVYYVATI